jgi:hypothetical protein
MDRETAQASLDHMTSTEQRATDDLDIRATISYFELAATLALVHGAAWQVGVRSFGLMFVMVLASCVAGGVMYWRGSIPKLSHQRGLKQHILGFARGFAFLFLTVLIFDKSLDWNAPNAGVTEREFVPLFILLMVGLIQFRTAPAALMKLQCFCWQVVVISILLLDPFNLGLRANPLAYSCGIAAVFVSHAAFARHNHRALFS